MLKQDFTNMTDGDYPTKRSLFYHVVFQKLIFKQKKKLYLSGI